MISVASSSSFADGETSSGMPGSVSRPTTSSAKRMVDMASAPSSGRMAARCCLLRMTTMPMPTRCCSSIAVASRP